MSNDYTAIAQFWEIQFAFCFDGVCLFVEKYCFDSVFIYVDYWTQLWLRKAFCDHCVLGFSGNDHVLAWEVQSTLETVLCDTGSVISAVSPYWSV